MITRWYEIVCDYCGCAEHYQGNIKLVEKQFRSSGGMITADKKYYCTEDCYKNSKWKVLRL